jgi:hypothetical protein
MPHRSQKQSLPAMPVLAAATMFSRPGDPHTDTDIEKRNGCEKTRVRLLMPTCIGAGVDKAISPLATD